MPPSFPALRGQSWSVTKTAKNSMTVAPHVSGREVRTRNWVQPLYNFELTFDGLASNGQFPGLGQNSLQILMGFYNSVGTFSPFLFTDPTDTLAVGQPIGTGDGTTTAFRLSRTLFNFVEPVGWVNYVSQVYVNSAPQNAIPPSWALAAPTSAVPYPNIQFVTAPAAGAMITADFNYQFVCRFSDDNVAFEQFMSNLWRQKSLKFQSLRNSGF